MATKKLQIIDNLIKEAQNADTLDGKHANEFAAVSDVEALQAKVGDTSVSEQISTAIDAIEHPVYVSEDSVDAGAEVINADTLEGHPASDFVTNEVLSSQLSDIKDDINTIFKAPHDVNVSSDEELDDWLRDYMADLQLNERKYVYISVTDIDLAIFSTGWFFELQRMSSSGIYRIKGNASFHTVYRTYNGLDDTFSEWEWVNPRMHLGVEYRTTERWYGKVVYTQLIDFGTLPNTAEKFMGCATFTQLCNSVCIITDGVYHSNANKETWVSFFNIQSGSIKLATSVDASNYTATVQLWYVKD